MTPGDSNIFQQTNGRTSGRPSLHSAELLFRCCFFSNHNLQVRGYIFVQLDRDDELADGFQRFVQLNFAAIDVEALFLETFGNVARGYRSEELIVLARLAGERHFEPIELLGKFFGFGLLFGLAPHRRSFHLLDDLLVGNRSLDCQFLRQKKIPAIPFGNLHDFSAVAQFGYIFLRMTSMR